MNKKNDKSKYSFGYTIPSENIVLSLTDTYLTTIKKQILLQNTGSKEWPIGTMLKSHENNVITFEDVIINSRYEIAPKAHTKSKISLIFPGDIEPGDYCVVVKVMLPKGEIIGDFFFSVAIYEDKKVNNNIKKPILNNHPNKNEVKEKKNENKKISNHSSPEENLDLQTEIERLKNKNLRLKDAFQVLKQESDDRYNTILREFREVYEKNEQLERQILSQKGNNENIDTLIQEKKNLLEENSKIKQEMNNKIKLFTKEKNSLHLLLVDEKKKTEELAQKKENEILVLVNKNRKEEEENQKTLDDLYGHIEVLEVQKCDLESENAKLKDKNNKHLNEFIKQKANMTKEIEELKSTIEIMKQNELKYIKENNEVKSQLDRQRLIKKDFQINKVIDISFIRTEQNNKISNNEKLLTINPSTFVNESKNVSKKNIIINEVNIQLCKNKENKENDIIQSDHNYNLTGYGAV